MKRSNSDIPAKSNKRQKLDTAELISPMQEHNSMPSIPTDVIKREILPFGAQDWLFVSQDYCWTALDHILDDSRVLARVSFAVIDQDHKLDNRIEQAASLLVSACKSYNFPLLERLLKDDRYVEDEMVLRHALGVSTECDGTRIFTDADRQVIQLLTHHKLFPNLPANNILFTAIQNGWMDIVKHIMNVSHDTDWSSSIYIYSDVPVEVIEFLRQDSRFCSLTDRDFAKALHRAMRKQRTEVMKLLLEEERTNFTSAVKILSQKLIGINLLLADARLLESKEHQLTLWKEVIVHNQPNDVFFLLQQEQLNPNLWTDNYLLYFASKYSSAGTVEVLLQDEQIVPAKRPMKRNPIVGALKSRHKGVLDVLLNHQKVDSQWLNKAFVYIAKEGYPKSVAFALRHYKEILSDKAKEKVKCLLDLDI
jgi:hypothetical protein